METNNPMISQAIQEIITKAEVFSSSLHGVGVHGTSPFMRLIPILDSMKTILIKWLEIVNAFSERITVMEGVRYVQHPIIFESATCESLFSIECRLMHIKMTVSSMHASGAPAEDFRVDGVSQRLYELVEFTRVKADRTAAWFQLMRGEEIHKERSRADIDAEIAACARLDAEKAQARTDRLVVVAQVSTQGSGVSLPPYAPNDGRSPFAQ